MNYNGGSRLPVARRSGTTGAAPSTAGHAATSTSSTRSPSHLHSTTPSSPGAASVARLSHALQLEHVPSNHSAVHHQSAGRQTGDRQQTQLGQPGHKSLPGARVEQSLSAVVKYFPDNFPGGGLRPLTLVLDLDQTVVLTGPARVIPGERHFEKLTIIGPGVITALRPYVKEFIMKIVPYYNIYIHTHGTWVYAERIIEALGLVPHVMGFHSRLSIASPLNKKKLSDLNIDSRMSIIVDDKSSVWSPTDRPNIVEIPAFEGAVNDSVLLPLGTLLVRLATELAAEVHTPDALVRWIAHCQDALHKHHHGQYHPFLTSGSSPLRVSGGSPGTYGWLESTLPGSSPVSVAGGPGSSGSPYASSLRSHADVQSASTELSSLRVSSKSLSGGPPSAGDMGGRS